MKALRMIKKVSKNGKLTIEIPKELGEQVEVIVFPTTVGAGAKEVVQYFECVAEDGTEYRVEDWTEIVVPGRCLVGGGRDWTDGEWQRFSLHSFTNTEDDKDVDWEAFFGVEDR